MICDKAIKYFGFDKKKAKKSYYVIITIDEFDTKDFIYCKDLTVAHDKLEQLYENKSAGDVFTVINIHGEQFVPKITGFELQPI